MSILSQYHANEASFFEETLARIGTISRAVEKVIELAILATRGETPLREDGNIAMGRLLLDSAVAVEQAFMGVYRAQPKLGWAAMRIAAESCKDLECLGSSQELVPLWLKVSEATSLKEYAKAEKAFSRARRKVPQTDSIEACQITMKLCNIFGSHPNSTSLQTMGPSRIDKKQGSVVLPSRVTDPKAIDFHISRMIVHGMGVALNLAHFRAATLDETEKRALLNKSDSLGSIVFPHLAKEDQESWSRYTSSQTC